jgi:hypothetical protein
VKRSFHTFERFTECHPKSCLEIGSALRCATTTLVLTASPAAAAKHAAK